MSNLLGVKVSHNDNQPATKSVTHEIANTHCIICGTAFPVVRVGKLYCSNKCKQFGYNHKDRVQMIWEIRESGISRTPISFFIDDYDEYNRFQRWSKRYKELEKKKREWDAINQEIKLSQNAGLPVRNYAWDNYVKGKLTGDEEGEHYGIKCEFDEDILELNLRELSIEQWSFLKSQQPALDNKAFLQFSSSLSREFMEQLRLKENDPKSNSQYYLIVNKFINHCNLIAEGIIRFIKRDEVDETKE
jgi:predicted nucleic acid-binding Zn ribbon protein